MSKLATAEALNLEMEEKKELLSPGPKSKALQEKREKYVPVGPYNITPFFAESAKGAIVKDVDGNELIDFAGGIGVMNVGHSPEKVVEALKNQLDRFIHTCYHVVQFDSYVELAEKLVHLTPGDFDKKAMFLNSGAEAIENAVKIARKYTGRSAVISFTGGYHGRTNMTMALTSKVKPYKHGFGPFASETYKVPYANCYRCPYNAAYPDCGLECADALENFFATEVAPDSVAAVIAEPIQGEGGFVIPPREYFKAIKATCEKHGIVFIADEIQTGFARTGHLFAMEYFGVEPDLMALSKSIAAGIPLSAVVGKSEMMDASGAGQLGGTFAGSPLGCVAGLKVLELIEEEGLVEQSNKVGEKIRKRFLEMKAKYPIIGDVRTMGSMCALELVLDRTTKEPAAAATKGFVDKTWQNGLITLSAGLLGNVIRILPPLVIGDEELEKGLDIMDQVMGEINAEYIN